jgi:putative hydrolase of the HAD superfamily
MNNATTYKAVLFDLGGTLVRTADPPEIFRRILDAYGVSVSADDIGRVHGKNQAKYDCQEMAETGLSYWFKWNLRILEGIGISENKEFLARKIDELWFEHSGLEAYPDAHKVLKPLKNKRIKMGIVTNGFERDYQYILQKLKLKGYFDVVVGADACKKAKPSREIFLYAARKLGVRVAETIFVGDSVEYDYEGAKRVGLKPLLINREGTAHEGVETIKSLPELLVYV